MSRIKPVYIGAVTRICVTDKTRLQATCSDIAAHFAKEWDVTVGRTTVGDIFALVTTSTISRKQTCVRMYEYIFFKSCNYIFEIIKSCNYIFEIITL